MKKLLLLLFVFLIGVVNYAQDSQNTIRITMRVNIRSGPGEQYTVYGGVGYGRDGLTVTGKTDFDSSRVCTGIWERDQDMWVRVDFEGFEGWVNYCTGRFDGDIDSLPVVEPAFPMEPIFALRTRWRDQLGEEPNTPFIVSRIRAFSIHLRSEPNLSAEIIDHIQLFWDIYVTGVSADGRWVRVEYEAQPSSCILQQEYPCRMQRVSGWVAKFLLQYPVGWDEIVPVVES